MESSRRDAFKALAMGALVAPELARAAGSEPTRAPAGGHGGHGGMAGVEGQRRADLGNGFFRNPIIAGDHADPTVLKDGDDYYMTFSSFVSMPGVVIWHSRDLVNWTPVCAALTNYIGDVWAMDLIKHNGRYFIYIPINAPDGSRTFVIWADDIRGPWSDPVDLKLPGCIDPGHVVGEDGKRYLFVNGIRKIALTDDGLATVGKLEHAYSPWQYPSDWVVEMFAPEGPKLFRRGEWFYLVTAVGGTSGPPTSHMVIAARSRSIHGPWEDCPHNPLVRTTSADEPWWSRGHASLVEGPAGDWWMIYHGYENGFRTLGRQTLLEPVEWTKDGWFRALGGDLSRPMRKPRQADGSRPVHPHGMALSDDFSTNRIGVQWAFQRPNPDEMKRVSFVPGALTIAGKGRSPVDCSPLAMVAGDRRYEATVALDVLPGGEGGLLLFYSERMFAGVGFTPDEMRTFNYGEEHGWMRTPMETSTVFIRLRNDENVVTMHYSHDGRNWTQHPWQMEVSGMHHNVLGGFLSLRPAIYSAGTGAIRLRDFRYRALPA
jgi:xylan 1,4-beta-xylosidase